MIPGGEAPPLARALVVDDEEPVAGKVASWLERLGCRAEVCTDTEAALERLGGAAFDIVVTDMLMEGAGGMGVLRRALERSPRTRVIILTGYPMVETAREAMAAGAFDFLAKPFRRAEIEDAVLRALDSLGLARPSAEGRRSPDAEGNPGPGDPNRE